MKIRHHITGKDLLVIFNDDGSPKTENCFTEKEFWEAVNEYKSMNPEFIKDHPRCSFLDCCGGDCAGIPSITYEGD